MLQCSALRLTLVERPKQNIENNPMHSSRRRPAQPAGFTETI